MPDEQLGYLALGWVTTGMLLSVPMVIAGVVLLVLAYQRANGRSGASARPSAPVREQGRLGGRRRMRQYLDLLEGDPRPRRAQRRPHRHRHAEPLRLPDALRSRRGFPVVTTKKLHLRSIIHELLWFLKARRTSSTCASNDVTIWDEWADEQGELGPVYGEQWRAWPTADGGHIDQISARSTSSATTRARAASS